MSRPEFESIVAGAPRENLKRTYFVPTGTLAISAERNIDFFSASGTISELKSLSFYLAKTSVSGSHILELKYSNATNSLFFTVTYPFGNNINFATNSFIGTPTSFSPSPIADFRLTYQNLFFDANTGLRFTYKNQTGAIKNFAADTNYIEFYAVEKTISI